ncbi:MAG: 2-dehydro-3-deoxyglucarate aldolase [Candidatus Latescibacteria bacterium]|nr:2-dehydro-3-deoxyglucarate aldolase [Candidatus Latescibacterota bacterium]
MRKNWVRQKALNGQPTLGAMLGLGSPNAAELMAQAGYDWLVVETEHNALDSAQIEHMLMAMNGTRTIPVVRLPSADPIGIQKALDVGALGVLLPMVRTAAEAAAIVGATRYPPQGCRGFGPLRASQYTMDYPDYLAAANDNILVLLILETRDALDNLEEIAAVPGVDGLLFGLFDLCLDMGLNPMDMPLPQIDATIEQALAQCQRTGMALGIGCGSPKELQQRLAQGFTLPLYGTDYMLLGNAARSGIRAFRQRQEDAS